MGAPVFVNGLPGITYNPSLEGELLAKRWTAIQHEMTVGWFIVLGGLIGVGALVAQTRSRGLIGTTEFRFTLPHGLGLQEGSPVVLKGIPVGEVHGVDLTNENQIAVTTYIMNRYAPHIYVDAHVTVEESPLGFSATKVVIEPGTSRLPADPSRPLPFKQTETLMDQVEGIQDKIGVVIERVDTFVQKAESALDQVRELANVVQNGEGLAGRMISDEQLAAEAAASVAKLNEILARLDSEEGEFRTLLRDVDATVVSVRSKVEEVNVDELVQSLQATADALTRTAKRMDVSEESREALAALQRASESFGLLSRELAREPSSVIWGKDAAEAPSLRRR
jgi:phospholipid/cholesterol/gamma-HCH transport system substrate-binding protein